MIQLLKTLWNLFLIFGTLAYFGGVTKLVMSLGESAAGLHDKGLINLSIYNRKLTGEHK